MLGAAATVEAFLGAHGLDGGQLASALSDARVSGDGEAPEWWGALESACRSPPALRLTRERAYGTDPVSTCLRLVAPVARDAGRQLLQHAHARRDVAELLAGQLAEELVGLCLPAVELELAAREAATAVAASRTAPVAGGPLLFALGDAAQLMAFWADSPWLARLVADRVRLAVDAGGEFLDRLDADLSALPVGPGPTVGDGRVTHLHGAGDAHEGGRRVIVVTFTSGARVVYKPRDLRADAAYQRVLTALCEAGFTPGLRRLAILTRGREYGWQEYVAPAPCPDEAAVEAAFRRIGGQLAVLHALRATDMHHENLIVAGEHPVIVDLETLLHPRLGGHDADVADPELASTGTTSVLRVGLLPRHDPLREIDISALGDDPTTCGDNRVRLRGEAVSARDHVDTIEAGFTQAYELLLVHRAAWLAPGGPLAACDDIEVRLVLRPTQSYEKLLSRLVRTPGALGDGRDAEEVLAVLWRAGARRADLRHVAAQEHDDLWRGMVPRFTTAPGASDIVHHSGAVATGALLPHRAPTARVTLELSATDLARQRHILRAALGGAPVAVAKQPSSATVEREALAPLRRLADAAVGRLDAIALRDGDQRAWLAPRASSGDRLDLADRSLAHGHAGILLALARYALLTGEPLARKLAAGTLGRVSSESGTIDEEAACVADTLVRLGVPVSAGRGARNDWRAVVRATAATRSAEHSDDATRLLAAADGGMPVDTADQLAAGALRDGLRFSAVELPGLDGLAGIVLAWTVLADP